MTVAFGILLALAVVVTLLLFRRPAPAVAPEFPSAPYRHLQPGQRYRVALPFTDHDGLAHPAGEAWTFVGHSYLPYENGLSLFVRGKSGVRQIRLRDAPEDDRAVVEALEAHIRPVEGDVASPARAP